MVQLLTFTFDVLHDHAEVAPCLKRAEHGDNKGVLGKRQDVPLHKRLLDLVPQHQVLTIYLFHGEPLPCLFMADQIHCPVKIKWHSLCPNLKIQMSALLSYYNLKLGLTLKMV